MVRVNEEGDANGRGVEPGGDVAALSRELSLSARRLDGPVRTQAAVAARHVRNASSRRNRSVRRDVRWRWTLKEL